jgi:hypothetical protein
MDPRNEPSPEFWAWFKNEMDELAATPFPLTEAAIIEAHNRQQEAEHKERAPQRD